jgi:hypothetical protein
MRHTHKARAGPEGDPIVEWGAEHRDVDAGKLRRIEHEWHPTERDADAGIAGFIRPQGQ